MMVCRCQDLLSGVIQPFINMVAKATGCPVFFIFGGPKPGDGGRMNIMLWVPECSVHVIQPNVYHESLHSEMGWTLVTIKWMFKESKRENYQHYFLPMFGTFFKKTFSEYNCHRCQLLWSHLWQLSKCVMHECSLWIHQPLKRLGWVRRSKLRLMLWRVPCTIKVASWSCLNSQSLQV